VEAEVLIIEQKTACYEVPKPINKNVVDVNRVLTLFFHPSISVTAMGGAEKRFIETLKHVCKSADFEFFVLESPPSLLTSQKIKCHKHLVSSSLRGKGWLSNYVVWVLWAFKASTKSISVAKKVKPQMIFVPNNTFPNVLSGFMARLILKLPLVVVVHHLDAPSLIVDRNGGRSLYSCYRNVGYSRLVALIKAASFYVAISLLKKVGFIIAVSNFTAETLKCSGILDARIFVSGNAVDVSFIGSVKPSDAKIYDGVFVGRIAKEKGVFDLVEAWKKVVKAKSDAKLLIAGSGVELQSLKKAVAIAGLEKNVFVRGRCDDLELYSLLKQSKVFVFPSLFEGWGISVAEALACGLPVVAYDIPALREVFGKCESVFLVPVKDIDGLVFAILDVLGKHEQEYNDLSYCAWSYSRRFCWEKVALRDMEILRML
jgi:glycosyltransferase involved in cell wall biosynthesis